LSENWLVRDGGQSGHATQTHPMTFVCASWKYHRLAVCTTVPGGYMLLTGSNVDNIDINILIDQWLTEHAREDRAWDKEVGVDVQFDKWEDMWYH